MIRQATANDLDEIARVHAKCFPNSFSTALCGGGLLKAFYNEYLKDVPGLFFVAEDEQNGICGFCMGYFCEHNEYWKKFLKHNFFRVFFRCIKLALTGNKAFYKKYSKRKVKPMF